MKYYEVECKLNNNSVLKHSHKSINISEAVKECSKHCDVVNIHEISESRYIAMEIAKRIRCSSSWLYCRHYAFELCAIAGMATTWDNCEGDELKEYVTTCQAAKELDVSICTLWGVK